jgi:hypothetical protein
LKGLLDTLKSEELLHAYRIAWSVWAWVFALFAGEDEAGLQEFRDRKHLRSGCGLGVSESGLSTCISLTDHGVLH